MLYQNKGLCLAKPNASIIPVKPMAEGFTECKDHIQFLFYLNLFLVIFNGCHEEKNARHFGN